jgi:ribosome-associated protein
MNEDVEVGADGIRLGQLLKLVGAAETGGAVKHLLGEGLVQVDGVVETRRGLQLSPGQVVSIGDDRWTLRPSA